MCSLFSLWGCFKCDVELPMIGSMSIFVATGFNASCSWLMTSWWVFIWLAWLFDPFRSHSEQLQSLSPQPSHGAWSLCPTLRHPVITSPHSIITHLIMPTLLDAYSNIIAYPAQITNVTGFSIATPLSFLSLFSTFVLHYPCLEYTDHSWVWNPVMYVLLPQFEYQLSLFCLNSCS